MKRVARQSRRTASNPLPSLLPAVVLSLGALSLFATAPAEADVLVSNIQQSVSTTLGEGHTFAFAQGFTTGDNGDGYILESIETRVTVVVTGGSTALTEAERATVKVQLWSSSSGAPGMKLADLTVPSEIAAGNKIIVTFSAPSNNRLELEANTEYYLVVFTTGSNLSRFSIPRDTTDSEDAGAASGWSIADGQLFAQTNEPSASTSWTSNPSSMYIRVNGAVDAGICGRPPAVRDAIVEAVSGVSDCADITSAHLSGISELEIEGCSGFICHNIKELSLWENSFQGLSSLQELSIEGFFGNLRPLPGNVFAGLSSLRVLNLQRNSLSSLPGNAFAGLSSLERLNLVDNSLSSLPEDVFDGLSSLERLSLQKNSLSSLPEGVFAGLSSLQQITLSENSLGSLPENVFDGLSSLQNLYLNKNFLLVFPARAFRDLTALNLLWLTDNDLA